MTIDTIDYQANKSILLHKYQVIWYLMIFRLIRDPIKYFEKMVFTIILITTPFLSIAQSRKKIENWKRLESMISSAEYQLFSGVSFKDLPDKCDSIIALAEAINDQNSILYGFYLKAGAYTEMKDYTKALEYLNQDNLDKNDDFYTYIQNFKKYYLGVIKYRMNNFTESMNYLNQAESFFKKDNTTAKNILLLGLIYKYKGRNYAENGVYSQAIDMYEKSVFYLKKTDFGYKIYELYRFIGWAYFLNRQFDPSLANEALRNYQKALSGFKKHQAAEELPWMYTNFSDFYLKNNNLRLAKLYQDSCMQIATKFNLVDLIGLSYNNYGEINSMANKQNDAILDFKKALGYYEKSNNKGNRIVTLHNLASAYNSLNLTDSAELYSNTSLAFALKFKNNDKIATSYQILSEVNYKKNNFKEAYLNFKQFKLFKDSVYQKQNMNIAYAMREIHETEIKDKENLILKNENQVKKYQIKSAQRKILLIIITAVLLLLIGVFFFYNMKKRKELQLQIETQRLLAEKFYIKEKTLEETERELHSLTNEIIGVAQSIKTKDVQSVLTSEVEILVELDLKMRNIQSLLKAPTEIAHFGIKLSAFLFQQKSLFNFEVLSNIDPDISWNTVNPIIQTHLYRITQLLLQNTNNHANASEAGISCYISKDKLNFMYSDDGIGYNPQELPKDKGLAEIYNRLCSIKGNMKDESKYQNGCEISIEIPLI